MYVFVEKTNRIGKNKNVFPVISEALNFKMFRGSMTLDPFR